MDNQTNQPIQTFAPGEKTKKCKFCQSEIPKKAKVCPVCKRKLKTIGCLPVIAVFILIIAGVAIYFAQINGIQKQVSGVSDNSEYITYEEYMAIENGMTYDEVKEIIGSAGTETARSGSGNYEAVIITWYGERLGSNANVTFMGGKVSGKAQIGLQ